MSIKGVETPAFNRLLVNPIKKVEDHRSKPYQKKVKPKKSPKTRCRSGHILDILV